MKRTIRLRGLNGPFKGQSWETAELLRVGRLGPLEVVLEDNSVSRNHAEIRFTDRGWRLRDLGSTNGTRLNGVRLSAGQWPLRVRDLIQFGEIAIVVEALSDSEVESEPNATEEMRVEATAKSSWDEALEGVAFDSNRCPRAGEQLLALLRAGHHLVHIEKEEDLLNSILNDAVAVLDAQRGAIVLAEGPENKLKLKALVTGRGEPRAIAAGRVGAGGRFQFSQSLANRCVSRGESILCHRVDEDPELAMAKSIAEGTMASVLCVLLRTPRKRLGVLHLDRSPWQKPFTMDDLHLADALAANVSAGIECAELVRKQRDLFLDTITILAQAVEMRDEYTGGHTLRVSTYSILLAQELNLPMQDIELIRIGTPLHDIGKIGIDDAILRKPDRLTPEEFEIMKTAHGQGRGDRLDRSGPTANHSHRPFASRTLGRQGLSGRSGRRSHFAAGARRGPGRRLRRHDLGSSLSQGHAAVHRLRGDRETGRPTIRSHLRRRLPGHARNHSQGNERPGGRAHSLQARPRPVDGLTTTRRGENRHFLDPTRSLVARKNLWTDGIGLGDFFVLPFFT